MKKKLLKVDVLPEKCTGCGECVPACPYGAISMGKRLETKGMALPLMTRNTLITAESVALVDEKRCTGCGECLSSCRYGALRQVSRRGRVAVLIVVAVVAAVLIAALCWSISHLSAWNAPVYPESASGQSSASELVFPIEGSARALDVTPESFSKVSQLWEQSYAVVLGTVTESDKTLSTEGNGAVLASVFVTRCWKSDLAAGEVISVEETGTRNNNADKSVGGAPLLAKGMEVLLFLTVPDAAVQGNGDVYGIEGDYYGKFFVDGDDMVYPSSFFSDDCQALSDFSAAMQLSAAEAMLDKYQR